RLAQVAGAAAEEAAGADAGHHVGDHGGDELVLADGGAELPALPGVARAGVEAGLGDADRAPGDAVAPLLERRGGDVRDAEADAADEARPRHPAGVQGDPGEHRGAGAEEAADRGRGEPRRAALDEEGGGLAAAPGEDEVEAGDLAEGRP